MAASISNFSVEAVKNQQLDYSWNINNITTSEVQSVSLIVTDRDASSGNTDSDINSYDIVPFDVNGSFVLTHSVSGLVIGKIYLGMLQVILTNGNIVTSSTVSKMVLGNPGKPDVGTSGTPQVLLLPGDTKLGFQLNIPTGGSLVDGYSTLTNVYVSISNGTDLHTSNFTITSEANYANTYYVENLENGIDHEVVVKYRNIIGSGQFSSTFTVQLADIPFAVEDLSVVETVEGSDIVISWSEPINAVALANDNEGITHYVVSRAVAGSNDYTLLNGNVQQLSYVDTSPPSYGVGYQYQVYGVNIRGNGRVSVSVPPIGKILPLSTSILQPGLTLVRGDEKITVTINSLTTYISYNTVGMVYADNRYTVNLYSDGGNVVLQQQVYDFTFGSGSRTFEFTGLTNGVEYTVKANAHFVSLAGNDYSTTTTRTSIPHGAPSAPFINNTYHSTDLSQSVRVNFTWLENDTTRNGNTGAIIFKVFVDGVEQAYDLNNDFVHDGVSGIGYVIMRGLVNGQTYNFKMTTAIENTTYNELLSSVDSNTVAGTPFKTPQEVLNLTLKVGGNTPDLVTASQTIYTTWEDDEPNYPKTYVVLLSGVDSNGDPINIQQLTTDKFISLNNTGIVPGTAYTVAVTGRITVDGTDYFGIANSAIAYPYADPLAPLNLVAESLDQAVRLTWDNPFTEGVNTYGVTPIGFAVYQDDVLLTDIVIGLGTEYYVLVGLSNNTSYTISVVVKGTVNGAIVYGSKVSSTLSPTITAPQKVTNLTAVAINLSSLKLTWSDDQTGVTYTVYKDNEVINSGSVSKEYTVNGLLENVGYNFRVVVVNDVDGAASTDVALTNVITGAVPLLNNLALTMPAPTVTRVTADLVPNYRDFTSIVLVLFGNDGTVTVVQLTDTNLTNALTNNGTNSQSFSYAHTVSSTITSVLAIFTNVVGTVTGNAEGDE